MSKAKSPRVVSICPNCSEPADQIGVERAAGAVDGPTWLRFSCAACKKQGRPSDFLRSRDGRRIEPVGVMRPSPIESVDPSTVESTAAPAVETETNSTTLDA